MTDYLGYGPAVRQRIAHQSKHLAQIINRCSKRELEMLIRYYVHGQDEQRVMSEMGCTAEEFEQLRIRLRSSVIPPEPANRRAATAN